MVSVTGTVRGLLAAPVDVIMIEPWYVPVARPVVMTLADKLAGALPVLGVTAIQVEDLDGAALNTTAETSLLVTASVFAATVAPAVAAVKLNNEGVLMRFGVAAGGAVVTLKVTPTV